MMRSITSRRQAILRFGLTSVGKRNAFCCGTRHTFCIFHHYNASSSWQRTNHKRTPFHYSNFTLNTEKSYFIGIFRLSCRQYCSASLFNIHRLYSNLIYFPPDASAGERRESAWLRAGWYSNGSFFQNIMEREREEETHTQMRWRMGREKSRERDWERSFIFKSAFSNFEF